MRHHTEPSRGAQGREARSQRVASPLHAKARRAEAELDPVELHGRAAAKLAGLRYVHDGDAGYTRRRVGKTFRYFSSDGAAVRDEAALTRIRKLAIPPAYAEVWICANPQGHLQATGRDARGRKQYRYHAKWREIRDTTKYQRLIEFGRVLPSLRKQVEQHLDSGGVGRDGVLAVVVRLLDTTLIRVGNEEYARSNKSYGLTTLRTRHVHFVHGAVRFAFRGKSGVEHLVTVEDRRVARALHRCMELPGQELFQYVDAHGARHHVDSADVNEYLHRLTGAEFTAKDYRTWAGSVLALDLLKTLRWQSATEAKRSLLGTIKQVAGRLRNTPAVCRKCYVHPSIVHHYTAGSLFELETARGRRYLSSEEATFLRFLEAMPAA